VECFLVEFLVCHLEEKDVRHHKHRHQHLSDFQQQMALHQDRLQQLDLDLEDQDLLHLQMKKYQDLLLVQEDKDLEDQDLRHLDLEDLDHLHLVLEDPDLLHHLVLEELDLHLLLVLEDKRLLMVTKNLLDRHRLHLAWEELVLHHLDLEDLDLHHLVLEKVDLHLLVLEELDHLRLVHLELPVHHQIEVHLLQFHFHKHLLMVTKNLLDRHRLVLV